MAAGRGRRDEHAEQAVLLATGARGEEEGIRRPVGGRATAKAIAQRPSMAIGDPSAEWSGPRC